MAGFSDLLQALSGHLGRQNCSPLAAPGIDFGIDAFVKITAQEAFEIGLEALIDRFAKTRAGTGGPA